MAAKRTKPAAKPDLMDEVFGDIAPTAKPKPKAKRDRSQLDLSPEEQTAVNRFFASYTVFKLADAKQKEAKAAALPLMADKLLEVWCEEGGRTQNPALVTDKGRGILQCREKLHFELPTDEEGVEGNPADLLMSAGFDEADAQEIAEKEFVTTVDRRFVNLSKVRGESPAGKKAVDKLLTFVRDNFSPEEKGMLLETVKSVELKEGFLDRAVKHCNGDPALLKSLFQHIKPEFLFSHINWSSGADDNQKATDALTHLSALPAPPPPAKKTFTSEDGAWYVEVEGNKAILFRVRGGERKRLGEKICDGGHDHALNTASKWTRDTEYRNQQIAKWTTD